MEHQEQFDIIERYLNHELSEVEKEDFELALKKDKKLASELDRRQVAHNAIEYLIAENLRAELKTLEKEEAPTPVIQMRRRKRFPLAIAAILVVLIGAFFFINPWGPSSPTQQILAYYEQPDFTFRSGQGDHLPSALIQAQRSIEGRSFDAGIRELQTIPSDDPYYLYAQYLLGHAYFEIKNYSSAQQSFEKVVRSEDIRYLEEAEWYGLLSCLLDGSVCTDKWAPLILREDHSFHQNAEDLREVLK